MSCPYFRHSQAPLCRLVKEGSGRVPARCADSFCRDEYSACPIFRFAKATGHGVHRADFLAWLVRGIRPGQLAPTESPLTP